MQANAPQSRPLGTRLRGALLLIGCGTLFMGVASLIKPPPRSATASTPPMSSNNSGDLELANRRGIVNPIQVNAATQTEATHPKGWKLIGTLEGVEHMVRCWASPEGPRYSVYTLDGRLIQSDLPADEVYRGFPDIELENLRTDPPQGGALLVDFADNWRE